jgi:potassium-transporting ATPase potassium-binding subunit
MWLLPALLLITAIVLSVPLSAYFAWLMDGKYHAPRFLRWFEELVDTGPQDWKQYVLAMLAFTVGLFVFGFVVLVYSRLRRSIRAAWARSSQRRSSTRSYPS